MITPILSETITDCAVCGEIACERDLVYVDGAEAAALAVAPDSIVCRDCAELLLADESEWLGTVAWGRGTEDR